MIYRLKGLMKVGLHMLIRTSDNASILASSSDASAPPLATSLHDDARSSVDESLRGRGGYTSSA